MLDPGAARSFQEGDMRGEGACSIHCKRWQPGVGCGRAGFRVHACSPVNSDFDLEGVLLHDGLDSREMLLNECSERVEER